MPESIATAFVAIRPQTAGFETDLKNSLGGIVKNVALGLGAAFAATQVVIPFFKDAFANSQDALKTAQQSEAVIKSTGGAANVTSASLDKLTKSEQDKIAVDDDLIRKSANMLLTFTNVRNEVGKGNDIFNQAVKVVQDMAAALGEDAVGASLQLGKALQDPIGGVTALRRVGVQLNDSQKSQIETFVHTGQIMQAQKIILAELTREFGGSAKAQATAADQASVAWGNLKESIGRAITPLVTLGSAGVIAGINVLRGVTEALGGIVAVGPAVILTLGFIGIAFDSALGPIGLFAGAIALSITALNLLGIIGPKAAEDTSDGIKGLADNLARVDASGAVVQFHKFAEAGDGVSKRLGSANRELTAFVRLAQESPAEAQKVIDGMKAQGVATGTYERALANIIARKKEDKSTTDAQTQANKNLLASIDDINDATLKAAGGQLGYQQAVIDVTKAQENLDKVNADPNSTVEDKTDATIRLAQANVQAASAANDNDKATEALIAQFRQVPGSIDAEITKMQEAKRLHPEIAASYDPIIARLQEIKRQIDILPAEKPINVFLTGDALGQVAEIQRALASIGAAGLANLSGAAITGAGGYTPQARYDTDGNYIGTFGGGGMVPGPPGKAWLATVHGGERIETPAQQSGGDVFQFTYESPPPDPIRHSIEVYKARRLAQWANSI